MRNKHLHTGFVLTLVVAVCMAMGATTARAQKYVVYSVVGKAYVQHGERFEPITARRYFTPKSRLKITEESAVTIIDEAKLKMFSFTRPGVNTVGSLIDLSSKRTKSLTKQYMSYLVKQLFNSNGKKMLHPDAYMQVTGTSYRAEATDSLMAARVVRIAAEGTAPEGTTEQQLFSSSNLIASDLDVQFELVDVQTGRPVGAHVAPNTACYVRVKNNTSEPLYVNVLNIDAQGNKYMVAPVATDASDITDTSFTANWLAPEGITVDYYTVTLTTYNDELPRPCSHARDLDLLGEETTIDVGELGNDLLFCLFGCSTVHHNLPCFFYLLAENLAAFFIISQHLGSRTSFDDSFFLRVRENLHVYVCIFQNKNSRCCRLTCMHR